MNGKPDGGEIQFERTVTSEKGNYSIAVLGKSDTVTQDNLTVTGTYHAVSNPYVEGTITNNSSKTVRYIKIKIALYDKNNSVIDTAWTYAIGAEGIAPGESSKWKVYCSEAEAISISFID
jgi:hypothetical protein